MTSAQFNDLVNYCLHCGQCNPACQTHMAGIFSPLGLIRDLQTKGMDETIKVQPLFNCLVCNRCMVACPMEAEKKDHMNIAETVRLLRTYASEKHLSVAKKSKNIGHTGITHEKYESTKNDQDLPVQAMRTWITQDSSLKISETGPIAYFVGCLTELKSRYGRSGTDYSAIPLAVVKILNALDITPVVLDLKCCGHDDYWAGNIAAFQALAKHNITQMQKAGVKIIITACAEGYRTWKFDYPKVIPEFKFEVYHISEFLSRENRWEKLPISSPLKISCTYQDPCRLGRMGSQIYDAPRDVLQHIPQVTFKEMENIKDQALCCGSGLYLSRSEGVNKMWAARVKEAIDTGAEYLLTACPKCATHFNSVLLESKYLPQDKPVPVVLDWIVFLSRCLRK